MSVTNLVLFKKETSQYTSKFLDASGQFTEAGDKILGELSKDNYELLKKLAKDQIPEAMFDLSLCLQHGYPLGKGKNKGEVDYELAFQLTEQAAKTMPIAQWMLGHHYKDVAMVGHLELKKEQRFEKAFHCFLSAANNNFSVAQWDLAEEYFYCKNMSQGILPPDQRSSEIKKEMAFKWYKKAADLGLAKAQYKLATMYQEGKKLPIEIKDSVRYQFAFEYCEKAAKQSHEDAKLLLPSLRVLALKSKDIEDTSEYSDSESSEVSDDEIDQSFNLKSSSHSSLKQKSKPKSTSKSKSTLNLTDQSNTLGYYAQQSSKSKENGMIQFQSESKSAKESEGFKGKEVDGTLQLLNKIHQSNTYNKQIQELWRLQTQMQSACELANMQILGLTTHIEQQEAQFKQTSEELTLLKSKRSALPPLPFDWTQFTPFKEPFPSQVQSQFKSPSMLKELQRKHPILAQQQSSINKQIHGLNLEMREHQDKECKMQTDILQSLKTCSNQLNSQCMDTQNKIQSLESELSLKKSMQEYNQDKDPNAKGSSSLKRSPEELSKDDQQKKGATKLQKLS